MPLGSTQSSKGMMMNLHNPSIVVMETYWDEVWLLQKGLAIMNTVVILNETHDKQPHYVILLHLRHVICFAELPQQ